MDRNEMIWKMMLAIAPVFVKEGLRDQIRIANAGHNPGDCTIEGKTIPEAYAEQIAKWATTIADEHNKLFASAIPKWKMDIYLRKIADCGFSFRTQNLLLYGRTIEEKPITTVGELVSYSYMQLMRRRNFGKKSYLEVRDFIERNGLEMEDTTYVDSI